MHIMKLTPIETVAESRFKRSFLFDVLSLTSWKELLYNSNLLWQILFSRGICNLKFEFLQQNHQEAKVISIIHQYNVGYI